MPMHYPPLADGTYRYGDTPRPLPSPEPGPDAQTDPFQALQYQETAPPGVPPGVPPGSAPPGSAPTGAPPGMPPQPDDPHHQALPTPPPERPDPDAKRRRDRVWAGSIVGVLGLVVVATGLTYFLTGSGSGTSPGSPSLLFPPPGQSAPDGMFAVDGTFTVVSSPGERVSGDSTSCSLPYSLSDIDEGTSIALNQADGTPISRATLAYDQGDLSSCTFSFDFPEVPAGESSYVIVLDGRGRLIYTEQELRAGVDITLGR